MRKHLLITVASAALIGVSGMALAQAPAPGGASNAPAAAPNAPVAAPSAPAATSAPMTRGDAAQPKGAPDTGMKGGQAERAPDAAKDGMKSKGASSETDSKSGGKDMRGKSASEMNTDKSKDGMKGDAKNASDSKSPDSKAAGTTTGQAGAGAKMSAEQRTTVRAAITKQNVKPVTNVNFSISIGTRVPRTVSFYPLPTEVITIYPSWRGYQFFRVGNEIIVVNPRTLEIVAVLEA